MKNDIICFVHLRWNFVYQRPQHLLSRFAKHNRVFIIEEPIFDAPSDYNEIYQDPESFAWIITPHLPMNLPLSSCINLQRTLLNMVLQSMNIEQYIVWYYSPMALPYSNHLLPRLVVYDCMDELSAFHFAPPAIKNYEAQLLKLADIVFTGGNHLYEAKKDQHHNIYSFPSSIDKKHFAKARKHLPDPEDQLTIPHPRIGFYGVIDERFNLLLLDEVATAQPSWQFILVGPVLKISIETLPQKDNIYYFGPKDYKKLPQYLSGWDIAMMPFALNDSTKYISPTKTPEYLAGGKPVISTSIRDVVFPYGQEGLVHIADSAITFAEAVNKILSDKNPSVWLQKVDDFLSDISWDSTWEKMNALISTTLEKKNLSVKSLKKDVYV